VPRVARDPPQVSLADRLASRRKRVWVEHGLAGGAVAADLVDLALRRGQCSAAEAALERLNDQRRVAHLPADLVQHEDVEVARDRVEPATVHDPHPSRAGAVVARDALMHEQDLAGQVQVVRPGGDAGIDELQAGLPVWADRRRHNPSAACHRRQRCLVGCVGYDQRPIHAEFRRRPLELLGRAAGEPDRDAGGRVLSQIPGDQATDESRHAEDDDIHALDPSTTAVDRDRDLRL
jgi:hypothetical protein